MASPADALLAETNKKCSAMPLCTSLLHCVQLRQEHKHFLFCFFFSNSLFSVSGHFNLHAAFQGTCPANAYQHMHKGDALCDAGKAGNAGKAGVAELLGLRIAAGISAENITDSKMVCGAGQRKRRAVFVYRLCVVAYMTMFIVSCIVCDAMQLKYLTKQVYLITYAYFLFAASFGKGEAEWFLSGGRVHSAKTAASGRAKATFVLAVIGVNGSFLAILTFWLVLARGHEEFRVWHDLWFGVNPHGLSFVLIVVDVYFFTGIRFGLAHAYMSVAYYLFYIFMSWLYAAYTHTWIYPFLALGTVTANYAYPIYVVLSLLTHCAMCALSRLRDRRKDAHKHSHKLKEERSDIPCSHIVPVPHAPLASIASAANGCSEGAGTDTSCGAAAVCVESTEGADDAADDDDGNVGGVGGAEGGACERGKGTRAGRCSWSSTEKAQAAEEERKRMERWQAVLVGESVRLSEAIRMKMVEMAPQCPLEVASASSA
ncbi:uncharacterized protein MONOS_12529 [Monocercomonoides exilis]|uniref:uncharacterized protein n=1 Tax=Monocercomonoides exilis TaxID=2049356 RepID=UPI003559D7AC|nr:hypothetical protein MONOS_12529 [Monocercomonoides exilis]